MAIRFIRQGECGPRSGKIDNSWWRQKSKVYWFVTGKSDITHAYLGGHHHLHSRTASLIQEESEKSPSAIQSTHFGGGGTFLCQINKNGDTLPAWQVWNQNLSEWCGHHGTDLIQNAYQGRSILGVQIQNQTLLASDLDVTKNRTIIKYSESSMN